MEIRHTTIVLHSVRSAIWLALFLLIPSPSRGQQAVDFRFAPAHWQTIICMPDDWLKTMVSDQGALTYDYGPGPYARPLTEISVGVKGVSLRVSRQYLEDPRVPIVTTTSEGDRLTMKQKAFALVPDKPSTLPKDGKKARVRRSGGLNGCVSWAVPPAGTDPAFRNVRLGQQQADQVFRAGRTWKQETRCHGGLRILQVGPGDQASGAARGRSSAFDGRPDEGQHEEPSVRVSFPGL